MKTGLEDQRIPRRTPSVIERKSNEDCVLKRKMMRFGILVLGLLIPGAFGRAETFTVDPGQSDVAFSLADVFHFGAWEASC